MPFVRANEITMHYDVGGSHDAPVVVLANALATNIDMWDDNVNALGRTHRVLRYDMRGHGLTDENPADRPKPDRIETLVDDVVALLDVLGMLCVSFVGLSIGGMVGQSFAARHPDRIDALVLCATGSRLGTVPIWNERLAEVERNGVEAVVDATMGRWFTEQTHANRSELVAGFANMVGRTPKTGYLACGRAVRDADLRFDDARIRARTLVIAGTYDGTATPEKAHELCHAIPGARLEMLHAAHMLCAEQPVAFNQVLMQFLEAPVTHA